MKKFFLLSIVLLAFSFSLLALAACSSDESEGTPSEVYDGVLTIPLMDDGVETKVHVDLGPKENLPAWLVPIVDHWDEGDKMKSTAVFTFTIDERRCYTVFNMISQQTPCYYYEDGTLVSENWNELSALLRESKDWCLVYCPNSDFVPVYVRR